MVRQALEKMDTVRSYQFVGDFCVAGIEGEGEYLTRVCFVPTGGSCESKSTPEEMIERIERHPKGPWEMFKATVDAEHLLAVLKRDAEKYPATALISKSLVRQFGCDEASALRLQFSSMGLSRYEFIREFCVVDLSAIGIGVKDHTVAVYYVPEIESINVDMAYELIVESIKSEPENDQKLIEMILVGELRGESAEDLRKKKHLEGVKLIEKLCGDCGTDIRQMSEVGNFARYARVRDWYIADVRNLNVHAPTLLMAIPGAEWVLSEMSFDAAVDAMNQADDETDLRWLKSIKEMTRDDRRYRTNWPI